MKHSITATSALALAASLVAGISYASVQTNAFVKWTSETPNISNATYTPGEEDESSYVNGALELDTGSTTNKITIDTTATTALTNAYNEGKGGVFSAKVAFTPCASADDVSFGNDATLKFALFAVANGAATNLYVYSKGGKADTGISLDGSLADISVTVTNEADTTKFYIAGANDNPYTAVNNGSLTGIDLNGNGKINDIYFTNEKGFVKGNSVTVGDSPVTLTEAQKAYLDTVVEQGNNTHENVLSALETLSVDEFNTAQLLNTDITKAEAATCTFTVASVTRSGANVVVTVTLTRNNAMGQINGNVVLQGSADNETFTDIGEATLTNDKFATGDTATLTFSKPNDKKFFKAVIK